MPDPNAEPGSRAAPPGRRVRQHRSGRRIDSQQPGSGCRGAFTARQARHACRGLPGHGNADGGPSRSSASHSRISRVIFTPGRPGCSGSPTGTPSPWPRWGSAPDRPLIGWGGGGCSPPGSPRSPPSERGGAMAAYAATIGFALAAGPAAGGVLTSGLGWRGLLPRGHGRTRICAAPYCTVRAGGQVNAEAAWCYLQPGPLAHDHKPVAFRNQVQAGPGPAPRGPGLAPHPRAAPGPEAGFATAYCWSNGSPPHYRRQRRSLEQ